MMSGKGKRRLEGWLFALRRYLAFFLLMAFVISCCMLLFLNELSAATGIALTKDKIESAAKLTFVNILFLSLLCTVIDGLRRKWLVERPVRTIVRAAEQIMKGDFSVRIPPLPGIENNSGFDVIADYFNWMAQELSGTETLRTDFIANVSHELKTPLAVIQNYGTMLQHPGLPEKKRMEYAKAITEASRRLADLITNILKLNKLENQQIYPQVETYDLGEQLCECLLSFEEAWGKKGAADRDGRAGGGPGGRRRAAALAGLEQPVLQRGQIHRAARQNLPLAADAGEICRHPGVGYRMRHPAGGGKTHL